MSLITIQVLDYGLQLRFPITVQCYGPRLPPGPQLDCAYMYIVRTEHRALVFMPMSQASLQKVNAGKMIKNMTWDAPRLRIMSVNFCQRNIFYTSTGRLLMKTRQYSYMFTMLKRILCRLNVIVWAKFHLVDL